MTLDGLRRELEQQARITARRTAIEWQNQIRQDEPVKTGRMLAATTVKDTPTGTGFRVEAAAETDYASYVSEGTRPHTIVPRRARALKFVVGGKTVFATKVNHPGTQPNTFWSKPLQNLATTIRRIWESI